MSTETSVTTIPDLNVLWPENDDVGNYGATHIRYLKVAVKSIAAAWTAYTPTIAVGSGSITTLGAVTGRYMLIGKTLHIKISAAITTNGTAATSLSASLPVTAAYPSGMAAASRQTIAGREDTGGTAIWGIVGVSDVLLTIVAAANAYPGSSGAVLLLGGTIEIT